MAHSSNDALTISKRSLRRLGLVIGGIIALAVIVLLAFTVIRALTASDPLASAIKSNEYQAVFLTNQQIYFGKLSSPGGDFYYLRHVYYLASQANGRGRGLQRTLVKLTADLHSPEDLMVINRSQILFVENLQPKGQAARLMGQP